MTPDQVAAAAAKYRKIWSYMKGSEPPADYAPPTHLTCPPPVAQVRHAVYMCDRIPELVAAGKTEKAMRWLGFVQGMLWSNGFCSIDDLKNDNR